MQENSCIYGKRLYVCTQSVLTDAAEKLYAEEYLGRKEVKYWKINHEFTDLHIELPDVAREFSEAYKMPEEMTPGVFMCTSDVGSSSIIARGYLRIGKHIAVTDEVMVSHRGMITGDDIVKTINENIFPKIRVLPEALATLIGKPVIDYSSVDLSTEEGAAANFNAVRVLIKDILNGPRFKRLSQKQRINLRECLTDEINSSVHYTLYDIAMIFMSLADRIEGADRFLQNEIRKGSAKVPFDLLSGKKKEESEDDIVLLPV